MKKSELWPFLIVSLAWGILFFWMSNPAAFLILWAACTVNFILIFVFLRKVGVLLSGKKTPEQLAKVVFWGTVKVFSLGFLLSLIWHFRKVPGMTLLLALLTIVVTPIIGGAIWNNTVRSE